MSSNSTNNQRVTGDISPSQALQQQSNLPGYLESNDIEQLRSELLRQQALIIDQQSTISKQEWALKLARTSTKKLRRELYLVQHVGELVDGILTNLERINIEDHILFFNYLLNVMPEQMQCDIKYYIPKLLSTKEADEKSNLFVSLFQNAYWLMQSSLDFTGTSSFSSILVQHELSELEAVNKEWIFITIENDTVGYVEFLRSDKQKLHVPNIESSVNRVLQYINSHISQLQYSIILHENNKLIQNHVTLIQTDLLTGINSRRWFFEKSEMLLRNYPNKPAVILAIDIDHFKKVNDSYGHAGGDVVLRNIAKILENELESYLSDMNSRNLIQNPVLGEVGRIGGEEFVIQLVGISLEQGYMLGENIRAVVECELQKFSDTDVIFHHVPITISMGVSELKKSLNGYTSAEQTDALRRADKALYQAKAAGRNRVVIFRNEMDNLKLTEPRAKPLIMIRKMVRRED